VAFVTESGLDTITLGASEDIAMEAESGSHGDLSTSDEPKALRTLMEIQRQVRGRLEVRLSKEPNFHRKTLFDVRDLNKPTCLSGHRI